MGLPELVVTEYVEQAGYAAEIYPESANMLRIHTMIDPETDEACIPGAFHRFGSSEIGHVDNWSAGGLSAGFDPETGSCSVPPSRQRSVGGSSESPSIRTLAPRSSARRFRPGPRSDPGFSTLRTSTETGSETGSRTWAGT